MNSNRGNLDMQNFHKKELGASSFYLTIPQWKKNRISSMWLSFQTIVTEFDSHKVLKWTLFSKLQ